MIGNTMVTLMVTLKKSTQKADSQYIISIGNTGNTEKYIK